MREIFLKIRSSDNMMTLIASNNFIGYVGEHLETVLKLEKQDCFEGFNICLKFQNNEDTYISEKLTIKDEFYLFKIPQILLKSGRVDVQLLLTESSPDKSEDIKIIKESSILPFICRESISEKDAQTVSDESKGLFVFKTSGDGNSYLGDDGKYHSLTYLSDFVKKLEQKLNNGELKGEKGDQGVQGEQGVQGVQGAQGLPGIVELSQNGSIYSLDNHIYYTTKEVTLKTHKTLSTYLVLPIGTFLLVKKSEDAFSNINMYITIWGSCTFKDTQYNYGIHQYYNNSNIIYNSMIIDVQNLENSIKSLENGKQDKLKVGAGITITDNGTISSDVGLKMIVLKEGEVLPGAPQKNTIYFKKNTETDDESTDWYEEYIWVNDWWELIGTTKVDLSAYAQKSEVPTKISQLQNDSGYITADDAPPEVYIGSEEPQGNEVIWVDNSTNPENINATKAYVNEKISNKQDAPKEQGTNGQVLGLSNGLPKWIDLPNQDDKWEFMGEIPIDLSEETSPLYEFALVKDFKRVRLFRIRPKYNSELSTFERLGVTKAIANGTSKKVPLGYNNDGYVYHFYEMWIDNLKTPFLITTEHNNMLSPAGIRLSSYRNSNIPNINSQLVTCQVTDQSAWYFEMDDKKKGWDGTEHYYWWGVRT